MAQNSAKRRFYPLSPLQQGMLFHCLRAPEEALYFEQIPILFEGDLDVAALEAAWTRVVARHDVLRTSFAWQKLKEPVQVVTPSLQPPVTVVDLSAILEPGEESGTAQNGAAEARLLEHVRHERRYPFRLDRAPLHRLTVVRLGTRTWGLNLAFHHLLLDGWSIPLVLSELFTVYDALVRGRPAPRLPDAPPYRRFIAWLHKQDQDRLRDYWRQRMAGFDEPIELRRLLGSPPRSTGEGPSQPRTLVSALPTKQSEQLVDFTRQHGLTRNTLFQGLLAVLLGRYAGRRDVVFGVTVSGRPPQLPGAERMVGLFIHTVPLRLRVDPEAAALAWLRQVQQEVGEQRAYEWVGLADVQAWSEVPGGQGLFDVLMVFENFPVDALAEASRGDGPKLRQLGFPTATNYPLTLTVLPQAQPLRLEGHFRPRQLDPTAVERLIHQWRALLDSLLESPQQRLDALSWLADAERHQLLLEFNDVAGSLDNGTLDRRSLEPWQGEARSIPALFARQVARRPDAVAAVYGQRHLSYGELAARARRRAAEMVRRGTARGEVVALLISPSSEMLSTLVGINLASAAYLCLDPRHPVSRLRTLLQDAGVRWLWAEPPWVELANTVARELAAVEVLILEDQPLEALARPLPTDELVVDGLGGDDLSHLIFTSGSTGRPKGIAVVHRGVLRLALDPAEFHFQAHDRVAQANNPGFDAFTWEVWSTLLRGATLIGLPRALVLDPPRLARQMERLRLSVALFTSALFSQLSREPAQRFAALRMLAFGGEAADLEAVRRVHAATAEGRGPRLINGYGPAENTTFSTVAVVPPGPAGDPLLHGETLPIGHPVSFSTAYVLSRELRVLPLQAPGELCVGGAGLARGYFSRPALTAAVFVPHPFSRTPGARLYRSGDLARRLPDGSLEFIGRVDHQIKIRGQRIEPAEIAAVLRTHSSVGEAVVRPVGEGFDARLVAWVVSADAEERRDELRAYLEARLPPYMVPASFVFLPALPLTANGKVDHRVLLRQHAPQAEMAGRAVETPSEVLVAQVFAEVLEDRLQEQPQSESTGGDAATLPATANFFDLGGHSLLAIRVVSRLRQQLPEAQRGGVELPVAILFDHPTIESLAAYLDQQLGQRDSAAATSSPAVGGDLSTTSLELPPVTAVDRSAFEAGVPLSFAQQRLWFLDRLEPGKAFYNIAASVELRGQLDARAVQAAVAGVIERHEILRTTYELHQGRPVQVVQPLASGPSTWPPRVDLRGLDWPDRETLTRRLARRESARPFDLETGPVVRVTLLVLDAERHALLSTLHHIAGDGWSMGHFVREFGQLYLESLEGQSLEKHPPEAHPDGALPALPVQYADFAVWQRRELADSGHLEAELDWWRDALAGLPEQLELQGDHPRPALQSYDGRNLPFDLDASVVMAVQRLARSEGVTSFMVLLAAFQVLLGRLAGVRDLAVGTPVAGRLRPEVEPLIGCFVNTLVLRADLEPASFNALLRRTRQRTLDAFAHQQVPFERLVEALAPSRDLAHAPLFQVMFALNNAPLGDLQLPGLELAALPSATGTSQFDLTLALQEVGEVGGAGRLVGEFEYASDLFDATTIARWGQAYRTLLAGALAQPETPIDALPVLPVAARHQLVHEWAGQAGEVEDEVDLAAFGAQRVATTPDVVAVVGQVETGPLAGVDEVLTWGALETRVALRAAQFHEMHAADETPVAVSLDRQPEAIVVLLALLRAGVPYLPLEPSWPDARRRQVVEDAGAAVATDLAPLHRKKTELGWSLPDSHLAYLIYTSGSTGKPKGVAVSRGALATFLAASRRRHGVTSTDRAVAFASLSFDSSIEEILLPLAAEGSVLLRPRVMPSPVELLRRFADTRVTLATLPTAYWHTLVTTLERGSAELPPSLRRIIIGGEAVSSERVQGWLQWLQTNPPHGSVADLVNTYGPTEATVVATAEVIQRGDGLPSTGRVSLGRAYGGTRAYVTDRRLRLLPAGAAGELQLGGDCLARGYWRRASLTAERFVPNPFAPNPFVLGLGHKDGRGARLYRTGDLARQLADGRLEYLGRIDQQVKVRGFRVELGELESVLLSHPAVVEAAVVVRREGGPASLHAFVSLAEGRDEGVDALRTFLADRLPAYLLPASIQRLDALPTTSAGKVDRRALAALPVVTVTPGARQEVETGNEASPAMLAPARVNDDLEARVIDVWARVLGIEAREIGRRRNFFDLGGHSLLLIEVQHELREALGREVAVVELFQYPTVAELADFLRRDGAAAALDPAAVRASPSSEAEDRSVAIIGMTGRFPGAADLEAFWDNLRSGVEGVRRLDAEHLRAAGEAVEAFEDPAYVPAMGVLDDADRFDARFFGYSPREAQMLDPQQRVFLELAWNALEDAGYDPRRHAERGGRIGVYVGAGNSGYQLNLYSHPKLVRSVGALQLDLASTANSLPQAVSYHLDLKGPSVHVYTACSTSLMAVHLACQALLDSDCDMALAGGVSVDAVQRGYRFEAGGILSEDGHTRSYDARATGTVRGNGAGVVVLKPLAAAQQAGDRILAVVRGTAANNDGSSKVGFTAPSVQGEAAAIRDALAAARVPASTVQLVEGHGSATALGDPIEVRALTLAFDAASAQGPPRRQSVALGSVKSNIGHLDTAAGIAGLLKTVQALRHRELPPSLGFETPNPDIDFDASPFYVNTELRPWPENRDADGAAIPRRAGVSSFGIGGTNLHVVLEEAPASLAAAHRNPATGAQLLVLSARTPEALEERRSQLAAYLRRHESLNLSDVAFTLLEGRTQFEQRWAAVVDHMEQDVEQAIELLHEAAPQAGDEESAPAGRSGLEALARRFLDGDLVDWSDVERAFGSEAASTTVRRVALPGYPFADERYWVDRRPDFLARLAEDEPSSASDLVVAAQPAGDPASSEDDDIHALPRPRLTTAYVEPREDLEARLATVWGLLLGIDGVGVYDNFFELGGHSLLGTQMLSRLRSDFGVELELRQLFEDATIAGLAEHVRAAAPASPSSGPSQTSQVASTVSAPVSAPLGPVPRDRPLPLSFAQQRLWFIDQLSPGEPAYNIGEVQVAEGDLDVAVLQRAVSEIVARHEALRTTFEVPRGAVEPVQVIAAPARVELPVVDVSQLDRDEQDDELQRLAINFQRLSFDLERGPLLRLCLVRLCRVRQSPIEAAGASSKAVSLPRHGVLSVMHHAVSDGWSVAVFMAELSSLYRAWIDQPDAPSPLPPLALQYPDFAVWQRQWLQGEVMQAHLAHWRGRLDGAPPLLSLPTDRPRPHEPDGRGALLRRPISMPLRLAVEALAAQHRATPFMVLLGVFLVLLQRFSGRDDLLVGTPVAGRNRSEIEPLIGFFVNTLVLRVFLGPREDQAEDIETAGATRVAFVDLIERVRDVTLDAYAHQDMPFERLVEELAPQRNLSFEPLFQVLFILQNIHTDARQLPGLTLRPVVADPEGARHDLVLSLYENPDGLLAEWHYASALFDWTTVARFHEAYANLLQAVLDDVHTPLFELSMLDAAARHQLLQEWPIWPHVEVPSTGPSSGPSSNSANNAERYVLGRGGELAAIGAPGQLWLGSDASGVQRPTGEMVRWSVEGRVVAVDTIDTTRETPSTDDASQGDSSTGGATTDEVHAEELAPATATERRLAAVWEEVLHASLAGQSVRRDDDFFQIGGHSLLATQVATRVRDTMGVEMPVAEIFEAPTLAGLAAWIDVQATAQGLALGADPIEPRRRFDEAGRELPPPPLSFAQERLWFLDRLAPESPIYNLPVSLRLRGALDVEALMRTVATIVGRHEALRTVYRRHAGRPVQIVLPAPDAARPSTWTSWSRAALDLSGLSGLSGATSPSSDAALREAERQAQIEALRPFDLASGPILRLLLLRLDEQDHALVINVHHIASDGWSLGIFVDELAVFYEAYLRPAYGGSPFSVDPEELLEPLAVQYADYALWQRRWLEQGGVLEAELDYWRSQLAGLPPRLELPTDRPRAALMSYRGADVAVTVSADMHERVKTMARTASVTPFVVLLTAFAELLGRYAGSRDIAVGTAVAGRVRTEIEPLIGFFVNTLVLRLASSGGGRTPHDFEHLLASGKRTTLDAFAHQSLPFERLVAELAPERDLAHAPLAQVLFVLQNTPSEDLELPGLQLERLATTGDTTKVDLSLNLGPGYHGILQGTIEYGADLWDESTIRRFYGHYLVLLEALLQQPQEPLHQHSLLDGGERWQVLTAWAQSPYPAQTQSQSQAPTIPPYDDDHTTLATLVALAAAQRPDSVALVGVAQRNSSGAGETHLSYGALLARADAWAARLRTEVATDLPGLGPETTVGLAFERSVERIVAQLAILRAGAAFVPLNPDEPVARLRDLVERAGLTAVLVDPARRDELASALPVPVLCEAGERLASPSSPSSPIGEDTAGTTADHLAYIIFTSGSTGLPKPVAVPHRGVVNLVRGQISSFSMTPAFRVLHLASPSFDASIAETFTTLAAGGALVVAPPVPLFGQDLADLLERQAIGMATIIPSSLAVLPYGTVPQGLSTQRVLPQLHDLLVAGEACPPELVARWAPGRSMWNVYGPTESSIGACYARVEAVEVAPPIGRPFPHYRLYILDRAGGALPAGPAGELAIGGVGVTRGYLGMPARTAEVFVPDSFHEEGLQEGGRLYRTGDLVRWRGDGQLEFLGRVDHQVKVRGFRVEPGEVEAVLAGHPSVRSAAVVAVREAAGGYRLVAWVAPPIDADLRQLRAYLADRLPAHMVPSAIQFLDALPTTVGGKVDRLALVALAQSAAQSAAQPRPRAGQDATASRPHAADALVRRGQVGAMDALGRRALERLVLEVWAEVLGLPADQLDAGDSFFEVGGHSLQLVEVQERLEERTGRELAVVDLFQHPTASTLAAHLSAGAALAPMLDTLDWDTSTQRQITADVVPRTGGREIAIIGMAFRFPGADDPATLWRRLRDGVESAHRFEVDELRAAGVPEDLLAHPDYVPVAAVVDDIDLFDARFFGYSPREAQTLDPQQRVFLETAWHALEHAGYDPRRPGLSSHGQAGITNGVDAAAAARIGLFAGAGQSTYVFNLYSNPEVMNAVSGLQAGLAGHSTMLTLPVSYRLDLTGPSINVQTACSTSLVATHMACRALVDGECEMALAGGVSIHAQPQGHLYQAEGILTRDGHNRSYDADASGTLGGNGAGIVVLKPLAAARRDGDRVYAVIQGTAVNNDGAHKVGYTAPGVAGQARAIREAQRDAAVPAATVQLIEGHGSATALGDPIEVRAIVEAFRAGGAEPGRDRVALSSIKSNFGHLDTAAGVAGLIKVALALHHRQLPPSVGYQRPNPKIDFGDLVQVTAELEAWPENRHPVSGAPLPRRAGVSSFGIGGTNAHVVLEEAPQLPPSEPPSRRAQILVLSAHSEVSLDAGLERLADWLAAERPSELDTTQPAAQAELADVAWTLQVGRGVFEHRRALVVDSLEDAAKVLSERDPRRLLQGATAHGAVRAGALTPPRPVAYLLGGVGDHYPDMGRGLYDSEPVFRQAVDTCLELLRPHLDVDLASVLYPPSKPAADGEASSGADGQAAGLDLRALLGRRAAPEASPLDRTLYLQPAVFVVGYALAQLWQSWGVPAAALLGYSLGEYTAACLAGVFDLDVAVELVARRAVLLEAQPPGAMMAVSLGEADVQRRLDELAQREPGAIVDLAAVNAPEVCVVAGTVEAVEALRQQLEADDISCRRLPTERAFHSRLLQPVADEVAELLRGKALHAPRVPWVSNVTGTWIRPEEATDPEYWARHLVRPVRFADAVATLTRELGDAALLEVGPGFGLGSLALQQPEDSAPEVAMASLRLRYEAMPQGAGGGDQRFALATLAKLWLAGVELDSAALYRGERRRRVELPLYAFDRQRYWVEARPLLSASSSASPNAAPSTGAAANPEVVASSEAGAASRTAYERTGLTTAYVEPVSDLQLRLASLWRDLLGVEAIGLHDSWFELGGHSLLGTQLIARLRQTFGVELTLQELFAEPTLEALERRLREVLPEAADPHPLPLSREGERGATARPSDLLSASADEGPAPLSFAQQRMWFLHRLEGSGSAYNIAAAHRLHGVFSPEWCARAVAAIVERHEILRTHYQGSGEDAVQVVTPAASALAIPLVVPLIDLGELPGRRRKVVAERLATREANRQFDLGAGPPVRVVLLRLSSAEHAILVTFHHIAADGWSMGVFLHEFTTFYRALAEAAVHGAVPDLSTLLPPLPVQYADFARWQRDWLASPAQQPTSPAQQTASAAEDMSSPAQQIASAAEGTAPSRLDRQLEFWRRQLHGVPTLNLPTDRPHPAKVDPRGARYEFDLRPALRSAVERLASSHGTSTFTVLLAAFQLLLARLSGQLDFAIGTPVAGRQRLETEPLIGFFVNTLVLRSELRSGPIPPHDTSRPVGFLDLLAAVRHSTLAAFDHQDIPFERLVEALVSERDARHTPLFQALFALQNAPGDAIPLAGLELRPQEQHAADVRFDLEAQVFEAGPDGSSWMLTLDYRRVLFDATTVQRWARHFEVLLDAITATPDAPLEALPISTAAEAHQLRVELNDTARLYPRDACLPTLLAAARTSRPDAIAVQAMTVQAMPIQGMPVQAMRGSGGVELEHYVSHGALARRVSSLASALRSRGVRRGDRVGLHMERGVSLVEAAMAVVEVGAAYLPIDLAYPEERVRSVLEDSGAVALWHGDEAGAAGATEASRPVLEWLGRLSTPQPASLKPDALHPDDLQPEDLAYLIYTSGSTGRPKAVAVPHRGVARTILGVDYARLHADLRIAQVVNPAFDAFAYELWAALLHGGCLVVVPRQVTLEPAAFEDYLRLRQVRNALVPSPLFARAVRSRASTFDVLEDLLVGGEAVDPEASRQLLERGAGRGFKGRFVNAYGPAENTVFSLLGEVEATDVLQGSAASVPIGRPLANSTVYLLDIHQHLAPIGVVGELWVGGEGLAQGYFGRPALTADRFRPHPWAGSSAVDAGARLYRTGDLARLLPDLRYDFVGRTDHQVKIRGYRIELGEIEAQLRSFDGVADAVVLVRYDLDATGHLVAYIERQDGAPSNTIERQDGASSNTVERESDQLDATKIRAHLTSRLPDYMVPRHLVLLDAFPLTPNGKVDRAALPVPEPGSEVREQAYTAPRTELEDALVELWEMLLGVERVGVHDDFFQLGGHSMLAMQMASQLEEMVGFPVPLEKLFEASNVAQLAAVLEAMSEELDEELDAPEDILDPDSIDPAIDS